MKYPRIEIVETTTQEIRERFHRKLIEWDDNLFWYLDSKGVPDIYLDLIIAGFEHTHEAACSILGHYVVDDDCGIPSHRYCIYCNRRFPNGMTCNGKLTVK